MRSLWNKLKVKQLDLLDSSEVTAIAAEVGLARTDTLALPKLPEKTPQADLEARTGVVGSPLMVPIDCVVEDQGNPRTEFPDEELIELADDIALRGILQPLVVHPADASGRYRLHFGAKRLRAALRAGLREVPVTVSDRPADPYAQVAENQKRHGLTSMDLARFIGSRVDAGESHVTIAKRLAMDLTSIAHHLTLLELSPEVEAAMKAGRCTAPRTLHELSKLHREAPDRVQALLAGDGDITRADVKEVRDDAQASQGRRTPVDQPTNWRLRADAACARLEYTLDQLAKAEPHADEASLDALKQRLAGLIGRLA
jgi:ParB family chromosome partitioning protein